MKKLGFGLMRLPLVDEDPSHIDLDRMQEMVDAFLEQGGTYFDTAWPYHGGKSEEAFRKTVAERYPRDAFTVTDKMPMYAIETKEQMAEIFNTQLEKCGVDYFDYYWLHALSAGSYEKAQRLGSFDFLSRMKEEGKIRHIGFSFHDHADVLDRILSEHPEVEIVQLQINYLDWDDPDVQSRECYETAVRHGKQVVVMEPVKGGALANLPEHAEQLLKDHNPDLSNAAWAIRYAASLDQVLTVLSGMSNMEQVQDNLSYMMEFQPLDEKEQAVLADALASIKDGIAIPCTGCRYCVSENECPMDIVIPDYFALRNDAGMLPHRLNYDKTRYANMSKNHGKASDCIECGQCEAHCPQHLSIRDFLKDVSAVLESE